MSDTIADVARRIKQGFQGNAEYDEADVRDELRQMVGRAHSHFTFQCPCGRACEVPAWTQKFRCICGELTFVTQAR